ncbi:MAG: YgiQ family radical SAM protein [Clostridia bacterium]|nr:YgiQ family radical SAM protein [Clostridia bacterium]
MMFLPVTAEELNGIQPDFVYVIGDAYVDHPSFGHAIISRLIESRGYTVAMLPQPQSDKDYLRFGAPKHGFLISSGVVDSMVNNYSVAKKRRKEDLYSEGGKTGMRPDRALTVYGRTLKRLFPGVPIVAGGIEASLRRFAHYDYWNNSVMPSVMQDACLDLLIYGMGEKPFFDILDMLDKGIPLAKIRSVRGTAYLSTKEELPQKLQKAIKEGEKGVTVIPSLREVTASKEQYADAFYLQMQNTDPFNAEVLVQQQEGGLLLVQNLPQYPLSVEEMDAVYALPYERLPHPMYKEGVPAIEEVRFSLTAQRGCFGSCSFCALTYHQGRHIQKRSEQSIVQEARLLTTLPDFKGYIHDVGGPTANFRNPACDKQKTHGACKDKFCIGNKPCKNLKVDHREYAALLRAVAEVKGVKKVFVRSGIRYDYLMYDPDDSFFRQLVTHHVSGQLKVAPEHCAEGVLAVMNKPNFELYRRFTEKYRVLTRQAGKEQYVVPYFISSHPGCTVRDAVKLTEYLKSIRYMPLQVQDFYPTPSTRSTCIFYTGIDPVTKKKLFVPRSLEEKSMQRALLQYRKPENRAIIERALIAAGRTDLIGGGEKCIITGCKPANLKNSKRPINKSKYGKGGKKG